MRLVPGTVSWSRGAVYTALALAALFFAGGLGTGAFTGGVSGPASAAAQELRLSEAVELLESEDPDEIRMGIEAMGLLGTPRAVPPLADRVRRGLPPELLEVAVDTLMVLGRPEAGPILYELTRHRRDGIRLKAVQAIVATDPRGAADALVEALNDGEPRVRGAAALGLGQIGARGSVDTLFHALDRGILEAATAIGQLARPPEVDRLLGYLGRIPFDALTPALGEVMARTDVPERSKLAVVADLQELATPDAKVFLEDYVATLPDGRDRAVRQAAEEAIQRIAD